MVDDEDYLFITNCYNIHIQKLDYVVVRVKSKYKNLGLYTDISLHKLLMNPEKTGKYNIIIDHKDGNPLNNQKSNLRICTHADNMKNKKVIKIGSFKKYKYKGVTFQNEGTWQARIHSDGKKTLIGFFKNEVAAANAYNHYAKLIHGEFARLNDCSFMSEEEWRSYQLPSRLKTSKYRGVSFVGGKWVAQIWDGKTNIKGGEFDNEEEAALAYNELAVQLKGDKAKINKLRSE